MRLFPKIDGVLDEADGVSWPPFATQVEAKVPDVYAFELFVRRDEEVDLER